MEKRFKAIKKKQDQKTKKKVDDIINEGFFSY